MKKVIIFISLFATPFLFTQAQKLWTLQDCINQALQSNIQVKQQQLNSNLSKLQYNQSIASFFPSINGSANHVYSNGQTLDPITNEFVSSLVQTNNFGISANLVLFNGLQQLNTLKQKQYDFLASKYDVEKMKNDISLTIAVSYLQILYNIELLNVAKNQFEISKEQVARTQKLFQAGSVAKGNLLSMEAQQASDELLMVNAQNQLDISYLTLVQLLDLKDTQGFEIVKPELSNPEASSLLQTVDEIYNKALGTQPDILSANYKIKSAKKGTSIAYGNLSPSLSLNGSVGTGYSENNTDRVVTSTSMALIGSTESGEPVYSPMQNYVMNKIPFKEQLNQNVYNSFGFYLSVPIFNKWQVQTGISTAKIGLKSAQLNLENTQNQLYKTIQQAYTDAKAALNKYNAASKSVDAMSESFNYVQQKFDNGMVTTLDFNDAKTKLLKAKSDALQAKYDYIFRLKVLDFYQGKALTF